MSLVEAESLRFPLLRINDKHIQRFDSVPQLRVESDFFLSKGAYAKGTYLLTAEGEHLDVVEIVKLRPSYSWKYWGAKHRAWVLQLSLAFRRKASLDEARDMLIEMIIKHGWHRQSDLSTSELTKYLQEATTFVDLYRRISFYGRW
jgi:hypothetical protein